MQNSQKDNNGWILTEAIITLILGILVLTSQIAADVAIPMVFGMWVMFSGVLRVVTATLIDRSNKRTNFTWTLITGVLCILGGLYAFLNPIIAGLAIAVLLGIMFLLQGISTLELGIHMPHEKKVKKPKTGKKRKTEKSQKSPAAQMQRENTVQKTQEGQPREVNSAAAQPEASKKQTSKNDVERAVERVEDIFWQN